LLLLCNAGCCQKAPAPTESTSAEVSESKAPATPNELFEVTEQLADLIQARLALMPDVARSKWQASLPVSVPQREAALLKELVEQATQNGVSAEFAQRFFEAQFSASRAIQQQLFDEWHAASPKPTFADAKDLNKDLRPEITRVSTAILPLLAKIESVLSERATTELIESQVTRLSASSANAAAIKLAFAPLLPGTE
jgi:chorismate mutase